MLRDERILLAQNELVKKAMTKIHRAVGNITLNWAVECLELSHSLLNHDLDRMKRSQRW